MTEHTTPVTETPSGLNNWLIIYGLDEGGRAHASKFAGAHAELVERAAAAMAMRTVRIEADAHEALLKRLPEGKLFGSGKAFVPFVKEATHQEIIALAKRLGQYEKGLPPRPLLPAAKQKPKAAPHHSPSSWADIRVGSLVLASEGHSRTDGWFEATVTEAKGDDLFSVTWRDWPDEDALIRRRQHLALLPTAIAEG